VRSLINSDRGFPFEKNSSGQLPLHVALDQNSVPQEVILLILQANENIFFELDKYKNSPLTLALEYQSEVIIAALLEAIIRITFSEERRSFWSQDEKTQQQIFYEICIAIRAKASCETIFTLMRYCPGCTTMRVDYTFDIEKEFEFYGYLLQISADNLLHLALINDSPPELVLDLVQRDVTRKESEKNKYFLPSSFPPNPSSCPPNPSSFPPFPPSFPPSLPIPLHSLPPLIRLHIACLNMHVKQSLSLMVMGFFHYTILCGQSPL
jgi:hypothetical protein